MTLLHVLGGDSMGGCERLSIDLASHYARTRNVRQAALFYGQAGDGPAWREFQQLGVETIVVPYKGRKLSFVQEIRRVCRDIQVKRVLTHGLGMHLLIAAGAKLAGAQHILALVGNPPPSEPSVLSRTRHRAQLARPIVNREIACSEYVRQLMIEHYRLPPSRVSVIHNWVRVDEIASRAEAVRKRNSESARSETGPVVVMVARLDPIKDHETVIRATAILKNDFPTIRLRLVGDGPIRQSLEALASELGLENSVEFAGARDDIPEQLGGSDVFVYGTTADEGFGIVLAEAMAAGLPVVCTDIGPCREVLNDGRAGVLVKPGSPVDVANAVGGLLRDRREAKRIASLGHQLAKDQYSVTRAAKEFDALLNWQKPDSDSDSDSDPDSDPALAETTQASSDTAERLRM